MRMQKRTPFIFIGVFLLVIVLLGITAIFHKQDKTHSDVVTSAYPLFYAAHMIAGTSLHVVNLTAKVPDMHDFEPSMQDIYAIKNAQAAFGVGVHADDWLFKARADALDMSKFIAIQPYIGTHEPNPHYWGNFDNYISLGREMAQVFARIDPRNKEAYATREKTFESHVLAMKQKYDEGLRECSNTHIVVSHDAYSYLLAPYGVTLYPVKQSDAEHVEPSLSAMAALVKRARDTNVTTVFYESDDGKDEAKAVADKIGAKIKPLYTLESSVASGGQDYMQMMEQNLHNLQEAMGCKK